MVGRRNLTGTCQISLGACESQYAVNLQATWTARSGDDIYRHVTAEDDQGLLGRVLAGDSAATRELVQILMPVIQIRVARMLRGRVPQGRDARQEMQDLVQDVFARIFANRAKVLRDWDPAKGAGLKTFVGVVADREVLSILRTAKRSPFTEEPKAQAQTDGEPSRGPLPEQRVAERERLVQVLRALRAQLSPQGFRVFEMLWGQGKSVEDVCDELELSKDAVYAWRSRIRKLARELSAPREEAH